MNLWKLLTIYVHCAKLYQRIYYFLIAQILLVYWIRLSGSKLLWHNFIVSTLSFEFIKMLFWVVYNKICTLLYSTRNFLVLNYELTTVTETVSINKANNHFRYVSRFLTLWQFSISSKRKINSHLRSLTCE